MLSYFRTRQSKIILYFITGLICIVMLSFGVVLRQYRPQESWILKVNGRKVPIKYFAASYQQATGYFQSLLQGQFNPQMLNLFPIHTMVMDNLKERELLTALTEKMNLVYSPAFVKSQILAQEVFRDNNQFSFDRYRNFLARGTVLSPITPKKYEAYLGQSFLVQTLDKTVRDSFLFTDDYQKIMKDLRQTEYKLQVYALKPEGIQAQSTVNDEEVSAFVADSKNHTLLQNAYFKKLNHYRIKETFTAKHILIALEANADPSKDQEASQKAQDLYEKIKQTPENFETLAKQHSEDPGSKEKGGDLGTFNSGDMVKPFEDQLRTLKPGEFSKPFKTPFGYHIAKLLAHTPEKVKQFDEVKLELAKEILLTQQRESLVTTTLPLLGQYFKDRKHTDIERVLSTTLAISPQDTDFFSIYQAEVPVLGKSYELRYHLKHHGNEYQNGDFITELIRVGNIPYVVRFKEKRDFFSKAGESPDPQAQFTQQMEQKWQEHFYTQFKEALTQWFDVVINEKALAALKSKQPVTPDDTDLPF